MKIKRFVICPFIFILFMVLTTCNNAKQQSIKTNPYSGKPLSIGIIGETPEVREKQVKFVKIQFSDLEKDKYNSKLGEWKL